MAEALANQLARERGLSIMAESAGTIPGEAVNPLASQAMTEIGLSIDGQRPKALTHEMAESADRIITMGCGVDAAACPARIHISEDWGLDDPAGMDIDSVRTIRDQIRTRVETLLKEMEDR